MKHALIAILTFFAVLTASAKPVKPETAKRIAGNFMKYQVGLTAELQMVYTASGGAENPSASAEAVNYFYVFNQNNNQAFVIISADDIAAPVLGYSTESGFDPTDMAPALVKWFEFYKSQIRYALVHNQSAGSDVESAWQTLASGKPLLHNRAGTVSPMLTTKWNQNPYYNDQCPYDKTKGQRTVVGCVATAMAQVIRYHQYPAQGSGFHSYNHNTYGTLSANFGNTTYNYANMPNSISGSNSDVAQLSYHCGISVDMNYGLASSGGSGAYVISSASPVTNCAEYALKTYFGYKSSLQGLQRNNYSTSTWISKLKTEMDNSRPVIYAGFGNGGGHCFVFDGYDNSDYFHVNWGWGGSYNGYFSVDAMNPQGLGTGGGSGGFNSNQQAIIGIEPPSGGGSSPNYNIVLYANISPSASSYSYGAGIQVTTNIYNNGTGDFAGDYGMAVFDNDNNFVDFVQIISGASLKAGYVYSNPVSFSTTQNLSFVPGNYSASLFYRPTGGNWQAAGNYNSYNNYGTFKVVFSSSIELYADLSTGTTDNKLEQGKSVTVTTDVANVGSTTFNGSFTVALYNLDGTFAELIETKTGMSLAKGYHYSNGLTFSSGSVNSSPGTYLLAVTFNNGGNYLCGSSNYQNPVKVTITEPAIKPDAYENNDDLASSYLLPVNFSGNNGLVTTEGSNFHLGSDYDFYRVNLTAGYKYTITARLQDENNSNNGNTYTVDALFVYSADGSSFSETYDYNMPSPISVNNGGNVYFKVAPFFSGNTGTYRLDLSISRTALSSVSNQNDLTTVIWPQPANDVLHIGKTLPGAGEAQLFTMDGRLILTQKTNGNEQTDIGVSHLKPGTYILKTSAGSETLSQPILISR